MRVQRRTLLWLAIGGGLIVALVLAFSPRPVAVDFATAERTDLSVSIDEEGESRVRDLFVVTAPISGYLDRVNIEAGDLVNKGETLIATIRPTPSPLIDPREEAQRRAAVQAAEAAVRAAEADVERLTADRRLAVAELERSTRLLETGAISQQQFDEIEARAASLAGALGSAQAVLGVRRSEFTMAQAALAPSADPETECACVEVRSVVDGVVLRVLRESAGPVSQGAELVELGDPRAIEVVVDLLSADAVRVSEGNPVLLGGWGGEPLVGRVRLVEPFAYTKVSALGVEEQRVNVIIDIVDGAGAGGGFGLDGAMTDGNGSTADTSRLGHGYRVDTQIVVWRGREVLSVPLTALFKRGTQWHAFVVENGRAMLRTLEVGRIARDRAEIRGGIDAGDTLVDYPSDRLHDGVRVRARDGTSDA